MVLGREEFQVLRLYRDLFTASLPEPQSQKLAEGTKVMYRLSVHNFVPAFSSSCTRNMTGSPRPFHRAPKSIRTSVFTLERYVTEVLMRDLVGHDHFPPAFFAYIFYRARATPDGPPQKPRRRRVC